MINLAGFKEFLGALGWFLTLGKSDTEHLRNELTDLLQHLSQSLKSLLELTDVLEAIPPDRFTKETFWPIHRHLLWFFTSEEAARQARTHCTDIRRDVARINFKAAKVLRAEGGNWKGIDDAFGHLLDADFSFLDQYEKELKRIGMELDAINQQLQAGNREEAWKQYDQLRSSLMNDRAQLRAEFARMTEAENHIHQLLT